MNVEDLASFALRRVTAYEGLAIDSATWTDAHTYHQTAQRLHTRGLHGWGIVSGLDVTPVEPPSRAVILQPGMAIDREGNVIRVAQPVRLVIEESVTGTAHVVLRFVETPVDSGTVPPSRVDELYQLIVGEPAVGANDIEVARIAIDNATSAITRARDPLAPIAHEIDGRFRRHLRWPSADTLVVGQLVLADGSNAGVHRQGLVNMLNGLRASAPYVVQFLGDVRAEDIAGSCNLLYLCAAGPVRLTAREGTQLLAFLRGGGILFAEPCVEMESSQKENGRFVASFQRLMADLKHELEPIGPGHPVFVARHVFGLPPAGTGGQAAILGKGNVILNPNDYGCCWQGGPTGKPLAREVIRGAVEFAENVGWHAANVASGT